MSKNYFTLYPNCRITVGFKRGIINDHVKSQYLSISKDFINIVDDLSQSSLEDYLKNTEYDKLDINSNLEFLIENKLGFIDSIISTDNLDNSYYYPGEISNCILDYNVIFKKQYQTILCELDRYNCSALQVRFFHQVHLDTLNNFINKLKDSRLQSVELIVRYNEEISVNDWKILFKSEPRITSLIIHSAPENKEVCMNILFTTIVIDSAKCCGKIGEEYLYTDRELYNESQKYNSCLNCKLGIDTEGNIKNCPSMSESFGNIKDTTIAEALKHTDFKKYWTISKDKIEVCKDCEFRHMCTDCRAYLKKADNIYSQPAKCNYNPYIAKWKGEDGYVSVEECGFYNEHGEFVLDKEKVDAYNLQLWGE